MKKIFEFPVKSIRKLPCPFEVDQSEKKATYYLTVNIKDVPEDIPMKTNPREQKLSTKVARKIEQSLIDETNLDFYLLNRGIVISAESVRFDNKRGIVKVTLADENVHGNIDGGHTYKIILNNKNNLQHDQFVRMEIMVGVEDIIEQLAAARNTSNQVDDKSIAELEGKFEVIKNALKNEPFYDQIAFKQYADGDIDAKEVVAILTMFNLNRFDHENHPISSFSNKQRCVDWYIQDYDNYALEDNPFYKLKNIAPDIFKLYSKIEKIFPEAYNSTGGAYGKFKYAGHKPGKIVQKLKFTGGKEGISYRVPDGFIYPILSAFRALIKEDLITGMYYWEADPFEYLDQLAQQLVLTTVNRGRTLGNNPGAVGKDSVHWGTLYMIVENKLLREQMS